MHGAIRKPMPRDKCARDCVINLADSDEATSPSVQVRHLKALDGLPRDQEAEITSRQRPPPRPLYKRDSIPSATYLREGDVTPAFPPPAHVNKWVFNP